jgi:hypothetical protein
VPNLTFVLDVAIVIAALTQAVSLADLILLPRQKARFETWIDGVTIWLDDLKTASFHQRWLRASRHAKLGEILFGCVTFIAVIGVPGYLAYLIFKSGFTWRGLVLVFGLFVIQAWCWAQSIKVFEFIGEEVFIALAGAKNMRAFVFAFLALALVGLVAVLGIGAVFYWALSYIEFGSFWHRVLQFLGNFYVGLVVTWVIVILDGAITLSIAAFVWPLRFAIATGRWFMWRVSSYPKGPLAALILFFGAVLAVARVAIER